MEQVTKVKVRAQIRTWGEEKTEGKYHLRKRDDFVSQLKDEE